MQFRRRLMILLAALLLVTGISMVLNRASFDPDFSIVDVLSGATRHSRRSSSKDTDAQTVWGYQAEDIALMDETAYVEETADTGDGRYVLLRKADLPEGKLRILADQEDADYTAAVQKVAAYYEGLGYTVEVRQCGETMMLSLAHAEHFDLFLLREAAL